MGLGKIIFFLACFGIAIKYAKAEYQKAGMAYGLLFGVSQVLGKMVLESSGGKLSQGWGAFVKDNGVSFIVMAMGVGGMASLAFSFCAWLCRRTKDAGHKRISYPAVYAVMLLCYLPCFIAYFPGCMSYDSWYITLEALGRIGFDNHHPFLHTFLWSIFAHMDEWLGVKQIGIILYTSTQLLVMVAIYADTCVWIFRRNLPEPLAKLAWIYYGFNPVFHIFTLILTKDVLFSGLFLLLNITLVDFLEAVYKDKSAPVDWQLQGKVTILLLLCCLFRNNMIYVVIAFAFLLCLGFRVPVFRCKSFLTAILLFYVITKVVYPGVGVAKGSVKEMLPVPLSQMAAVYHSEDDSLKKESGQLTAWEEGLETEEKELILKYVPSVEYYDCFFADPIKSDFNENAFEENRGEFFRLWGRLFKKYPVIYGRAFLALNLPFWYPEMESVREYIETDNYSQDYPVQRKGWLPGVYNWYERVSENQALWMHLPIFRQLYAIGVPIWVLLFFGIWFGISKRKDALSVVILSILLWMTYLLGPVSSFRYVEPLLLTYPLWLALGAGAYLENRPSSA